MSQHCKPLPPWAEGKHNPKANRTAATTRFGTLIPAPLCSNSTIEQTRDFSFGRAGSQSAAPQPTLVTKLGLGIPPLLPAACHQRVSLPPLSCPSLLLMTQLVDSFERPIFRVRLRNQNSPRLPAN